MEVILTILLFGGNSYLVSLRVKIKKDYFLSLCITRFETFLYEEKEVQKIKPPFDIPFERITPYDEKKLNYIEDVIISATYKAHLDSGKQIIKITFNQKSPKLLGYLFYFFQKSCAYSGELLGVNPYNQDGVESYKTNMKNILKGDKNE